MRAALVSWSVSVIVACGGSHEADDAGADAGRRACASDRDCSAFALVCAPDRGVCVECVGAADCTSEEICLGGDCVARVPCTSSRMCPGGVCDRDRGFCVECVGVADCPAGEECRDGACVSPPPPECSVDGDCAAGMRCDEGACVVLACASAADCDDGMFCNGGEACMAGAAGADPQGCVAGMAPCAAESCDEGADSCTVCDADADGHEATGCGGDDCDDSDPDVRPGAMELCDRLDGDCSAGGGIAVDEDADDDGYAPVGASCTGGARPALDCDDASATINPAAIESCNATDDNCAGGADEEPAASASCPAGESCMAGACGVGPTVVQVGGGATFSCAVISDGTVMCWGSNEDYQLGRGFRSDRPATFGPDRVVDVSGAVEVAGGQNYACVRTVLGGVTCWGMGAGGPFGTRPTPVSGLSDVVALSAGDFHICAVRRDGSIACMGNNNDGELGDGTTSTTRVTAPVTVLGITNAVEVAAGSDHSCARLATGGVMCWGDGSMGQLGHGAFSDSLTPTAVSGLADATDLARGSSHSCATRATGETVCWGANYFGSVGDGTAAPRSAPVVVTGLGTGASLARTLSGATSCARRASGQTACWGYGERGTIGDGTGLDRNVPTDTVGLPTVLDLAGDQDHYCAIAADGVSCWGSNASGEIGDGTTRNALVPTRVVGL